jgi:hypothetical protein
LGVKKKREKHGRTIDLIQEDNHFGGAVRWSPRKFDQACERQSQREQGEEQEKLRKTNLKELKASISYSTRSFKKRGVLRKRG